MFHGALKNIMGTRFDILIIDQIRLKSREIWGEIAFELRRLDQLFNRFDEVSETSKINREAALAPVQVSPEMWFVLQNCRQYYRRTLKLFDITLDDFSKVVLDENDHSVSFSQEDITLDFGGYAKGYALVKIRDLIARSEVQHCFIDFGNSSSWGLGIILMETHGRLVLKTHITGLSFWMRLPYRIWLYQSQVIRLPIPGILYDLTRGSR